MLISTSKKVAVRTTDNKYWSLHNHKIFDQLNEQQLKELSVLVGYFKYKKNDVVHLFSDETKRMYFLKEGMLKAVRKQDEKTEVVTDLIHKGDVFGEFTINRDNNTDLLKVVSTEALICAFTLENFEKLMQKYPTICMKVCKHFGEKIVEVNKKYTDIVFKDSKTRLIEFLIGFCERYGEKNDNKIVVKNYLTQEEISNLIGCKRQTVTLLMRELQQEGKISYTRNNLIIHTIN